MKPLINAILVLCCTTLALAQNPPDAQQLATRVAPYVDEHTVLVAHLDLTRVDIDSAARWLTEQINAARLTDAERAELLADVEHTRTPAKGMLQALRDAGGREVYFVLSLRDIPASPGFVLMPLEPNADVRALRGVLLSGAADGPVESGEAQPWAEVTAVLDGMIYRGNRQTLERLRQIKPAETALADAFAAGGDAPLRIAILPTADMRRVITELMPTLPEALGGGSSRPITQITWTTVGITPPPQPAVRLTIQAADGEAAAALEPVLQKALAWLKQLPPLAPAKALLDKLQVERRDAQLHVAIDPKLLEELVAGQVLPMLIKARPDALRVQSASNLRMIGQAILLYYNAHKQMPPDLRTAAKDQDLAVQVLKNPARPQWDLGYEYIAPPDESSPPDMVIAHEKYEQWGDGIHVLFGDGHVDWITNEQDFKAALARTAEYNEKRRQELQQKKQQEQEP